MTRSRPDDAAHPLLPPATPLLAGDDGALQVGGVAGGDGVLLPGAPGWAAPLLRGLDGRRTQRAVLAEARADGLDPAAVAGLLGALRGRGLLLDLEPADLLAAGAGPAAAARDVAELAGTPGAGAAGRRARRAAGVVVEGATRVGVPLAAVLAASGVGRVSVRDPGVVSAGDAVVGGLSVADEGRPRALAAADAVRRVAPSADLRPPAPGRSPDLVVLARPWAASDPLAAGVHRRGLPHLVATVRGDTGVVGPLVVPGATSCLRCADLHRRDTDPRWPRLAAQLTAAEAPPSGTTLVCLLTALLAAVQVLAHLDGAGAPVTLGATVELEPPGLLPRLRRWPPHPACDCLDGEAGPAPGGVTGRDAHRVPHPVPHPDPPPAPDRGAASGDAGPRGMMAG